MILKSPIETGYIENQQKKKRDKRGPVSEFLWKLGQILACTDPHKDWALYQECLEKQLENRRPPTLSDWQSEKHFLTAEKVTSIINSIAWSKPFSFYPEDPYYIIGECEVGDLSEIEIIMKIENKFKIQFPKEFYGMIADGLTFGEMVDLIIELQQVRK